MRARRIRRWWILLVVLAPLAGFLAMVGCATLPSLDGRTVSTALDAEQARATRLGVAAQPLVAAHPGTSGLLPLADPQAAFAARVLLARHAERTIDAQYYIWQNDTTGTMLLAELERAARRGVRVRLLLDDNGIRGLDDTLVALAAQPNFEVRLFNPFTFRHPKWANYLTAFPRLNHRMHNKSFTVDNVATIIGGRNIGDNYFGATDDVEFADLDVLAVGPVVPDVSAEFDRYWASSRAYPIERIVRAPAADTLARFQARVDALERADATSTYRMALQEDDAVRRLADGSAQLIWASTRMYSDPPEKTLAGASTQARLIDGLLPVFANTRHSLQLITAYFVPGAAGLREFTGMAGRGVDVRILTNSLAATDTAAVHAGYLKYRKRLLKAGVKLYELRRTSERNPDRARMGASGSSASSLHAKTFAIDDRQVFIGSFNFDPRSVYLNTEMGFLIDSPALAQQMATAFAQDIPGHAYQLQLEGKDIRWVLRVDGDSRSYTTDPDSSWAQRAWARFLSWLPIEWLL